MGYIDSHAHLTGEIYKENLIQIIEDFSVNEIDRVLLICCDEVDYTDSLQLQSQYDCFDIAKGIHPESANKDRTIELEQLDKQLYQRSIDVVGEIGLDYYWTKDNKEYQKELFIKQIQFADKYDLPISVHCRDAAEDTYNILKNYHFSKKGVMHCFSGSVEMMWRFVKLGYYISVAGPVTFNNARVVKEVAATIPLDNILYETDSPYLTPMPFRGKRNNPNLIIYTAKMIAELKGISVEFLNKTVKLNYQKLLGIENV